MDDEAVGDLGQLLDDAVELARAEAHPGPVERRVRAARDDAAAALGEPDPVALAPDPGEHVEVRAAIERAVRVPPQGNGHRRHRPRDHELSQLADDRLAARVVGVGRDAEEAARDLALVHGQQRRPAHDAAAHVGAAAAVDQQHVGAELLVHVAVPLRRKGRAGRAEDADRAEIVLAPGLQARTAAGHQEPRAHAHEGRARLLGDPPLPAEVRPRRIAVEHHDRRPHEQCRHERVPHHPRGRGEPEQSSAGLQIPAERVRLEELEQDAAVPVDDRLRAARRPRREEHEQRVVEGHGLERERAGLGEQLVPRARARQPVVAVPERDVHDVLEGRKGRANRRHLLAPVDRAVPEAVAPDRQQHLRLELREPVDHAARAELGRAAHPDGAEARGRRERDRRLGDVRQVRGHAVARADAEPRETRPGASHLLAERSRT